MSEMLDYYGIVPTNSEHKVQRKRLGILSAFNRAIASGKACGEESLPAPVAFLSMGTSYSIASLRCVPDG